jgi:eukaryotic-like serine/threonine-protein kinase
MLAPSFPALGSAIGSRYELLEKLASGGMATVYLGRARGARGFSRLVAIKRAHPHLIRDDAFARMLMREAKLAARIHHSNVVSVLDVVQAEGELFLVLDYVEGCSLAELVAHGRERGALLPAPVAIRIVLDACAGLQAAHEAKDATGRPTPIVHRDVSPQNIMVGADGVTKLTDFGIAKSLSFDTVVTGTGLLLGKLAYMAPEYVASRQLDERSDLFGVGVVLWEALAGRRLFGGSNPVETLERVQTLTPPPVSQSNSAIPRAVDRVIERALEKSPVDRYATPRQFARELELVARSAGLVAEHDTVGQHVRAVAGTMLQARSASLADALRHDAPGAQTASMPIPKPVISEDTESEAPTRELERAPELEPVRRAPRLALLALSVAAVAALSLALLWPRRDRPGQTEPADHPRKATDAEAGKPSPSEAVSTAPSAANLLDASPRPAVSAALLPPRAPSPRRQPTPKLVPRAPSDAGRPVQPNPYNSP